MGQTLSRRPLSQRSSFATLTGASSPNAPDQSQYQGYNTPQPQQMIADPASLTMPITSFQLPTSLGGGFGGYGRQLMAQRAQNLEQ